MRTYVLRALYYCRGCLLCIVVSAPDEAAARALAHAYGGDERFVKHFPTYDEATEHDIQYTMPADRSPWLVAPCTDLGECVLQESKMICRELDGN